MPDSTFKEKYGGGSWPTVEKENNPSPSTSPSSSKKPMREEEPENLESKIVDGKLEFFCTLKEPIATPFAKEAAEAERGASAQVRFALKRYYLWKEEIDRLGKIEEDYKKLKEENARLRRYVTEGPDTSQPGPDFRSTTSKPDLRETAG